MDQRLTAVPSIRTGRATSLQMALSALPDEHTVAPDLPDSVKGHFVHGAIVFHGIE